MLSRQKKSDLADQSAIVDEAIESRRSVRAFLPDPVDELTIRTILEVASRAPSGTNMQPWRVYVTSGVLKQRLTDAILNSGIRAEKAKWDEYKYYPDQFFEPYYARRRAVGFALYSTLGIGRRDVNQMREQHDRNFVFFDAPVGMIFTIDRRLNQGSWIDYGMFLQNIMVAARARGLHTCPQAAFAPYHNQIRPRARHTARRDRGLRHGARLRGSKQAGEPAAHRTGAARRMGRLSRLVTGNPGHGQSSLSQQWHAGDVPRHRPRPRVPTSPSCNSRD